MKFLREPSENAVVAVGDRIASSLADGKRVLWLVSGGSNVAAEVEVLAYIRSKAQSNLGGLAIMPMDERYGPEGHADSNIQALRESGFSEEGITLVDVLIHNTSLQATVEFYAEVGLAAITNADIIVGQFGLGTDGHTAGILPASPATEENSAVAIGYEWSDYTRLSLTPQALQRCTVAFVLAYGKAKEQPLRALQANQELLETFPAKLLYEIKEVNIYNDVIESGETA